MQSIDPGEASAEAGHVNDWSAGGVTVTVAVVDCPSTAAVRTTVCAVLTGFAPDTNCVDVAPAGTITEGETGIAALSLDRLTIKPSVAGAVRVAVQLRLLPPRMVVGEQIKEVSHPCAWTVRVAVVVTPPAAAEMVALPAVTPAVTVKPALEAPDATVTEDGSVTTLLFVDRATTTG